MAGHVVGFVEQGADIERQAAAADAAVEGVAQAFESGDALVELAAP